MSDKEDHNVAYDPPDHALHEIVNDHPVVAVVTAFLIGLILAKLAF